jgi:hypothetical protein
LIVEIANGQRFTKSESAEKLSASDVDVVSPASIKDHALSVTFPVANAKIVAEGITQFC